jgi:dTDP-4-amino-4,6-dideoxygalactose transaminase
MSLSETCQPGFSHTESLQGANWPTWPIFDEAERNYLLEVLNSGKWWFGEKVRFFEEEFASFQGSKYAVSCTNGTAALEMALRGLGVVEGDEVIVPGYSFIATASAVITVGAIPVFADIEEDSLCLDPEDVQRKLNSRTKAIIPVHVAGCIADMSSLADIAERNGLQLLEDASHAWGSERNGRGAGLLGRCGTFSFQMSKNITAGEGGIMVTNDEELADICRSYTHCGRRKGAAWYDHDYLGSNLRMTEFQAAMLIAQMGRAEEQLAIRQANAEYLDRELSGVRGVKLVARGSSHTRRSYHMYVIRMDKLLLGCSREDFIKALNNEGIPASKGWYRPLYANDVFQKAHGTQPHGIRAPLANKNVDYRDVNCPVCEQVCSDAVWIPQNVLLAERRLIQGVAATIKKLALNSGL